ncbi:MAG: hypothetical protein FWC95_08085 [Defluviitaleaceae bacterium]|nr:hypothetical protein [Defluviitaleaceae bacterium]
MKNAEMSFRASTEALSEVVNELQRQMNAKYRKRETLSEAQINAFTEFNNLYKYKTYAAINNINGIINAAKLTLKFLE